MQWVIPEKQKLSMTFSYFNKHEVLCILPTQTSYGHSYYSVSIALTLAKLLTSFPYVSSVFFFFKQNPYQDFVM